MGEDFDTDGDWSPDQLTGYYGKVAHAWFTTDANLQDLLPAPLVPSDLHRAFVKIYQLKSTKIGSKPYAPAFSQYKQVCVTVLAAPPGLPLRHYNMFMWEDRAWASRSGGTPSWNKKQADIEMTWIFPVEERFLDHDRAFVADVTIATHTILHFESVLDGVVRVDAPPLAPGFYCGGGEQNLYHIPLREAYLGEPEHGSGTLFIGGPAPNERRELGWHADVLGPVKVEGVVVQDVFFSRVFSDLRRVEISEWVS